MKVLIIGRGHCGQGLAKVFEARGVPYKLVSHKCNWEHDITYECCDLVINAAGVGGAKQCEALSESEVMDGNVHLPYAIAETAKTWNVPCALISTGGVYAKPAQVIKRETDDLYMPNRYIESKIRMEQLCKDTDATIFRLSNLKGDGTHPNDYVNRIRSWGYVVNTYASTLTLERFASTLLNLVYTPEMKGEIFNIADPTFTYLPSLALGKKVIDPSEQSETATVSHILGVQKLWRQMSLRKTEQPTNTELGKRS